MELIHTTEDIVYLHHLKNLLETAGVESIIKNDSLMTISGEIPMTNCWPELWILNDSKLLLANQILDEDRISLSETHASETWVCEICREEHLKQFSDCWNCHSIENETIIKAF